MFNMWLLSRASLLLLSAVVFCYGHNLDNTISGDKNETPKWPMTYTLDGIIQIPYAEIEEPFTAYLTQTYGRSRIDFYGGKLASVHALHIGT